MTAFFELHVRHVVLVYEAAAQCALVQPHVFLRIQPRLPSALTGARIVAENIGM